MRYNTRLSGVSLPLSASEQHLTMGLMKSRIVPEDRSRPITSYSEVVTDEGYVIVTDHTDAHIRRLCEEAQAAYVRESLKNLPPISDDPVSVCYSSGVSTVLDVFFLFNSNILFIFI